MLGMTTPTPTALRAVTLPIPTGGEFAARLVLTAPGQTTDSGAWAITHPLGGLAGGTHTEVAFPDGTGAVLTDQQADQIVSMIAENLYPAGGWAFHYSPERVPDSVLRYGSQLRARVEVTAVEVWS